MFLPFLQKKPLSCARICSFFCFHHQSTLLFLCLISCCLTLLCCPSHSLSTSSVAFLWPFTPSRFILPSFIPKLITSLNHSFICSHPPSHVVFSFPSHSCPPSPICWRSAVSAVLPVLTKCGADIGKMPQNMACRRRHHGEWIDIFYQMSLSPDQPSLSSRGNRSAFWHPVTHTGHTPHTNIWVCSPKWLPAFTSFTNSPEVKMKTLYYNFAFTDLTYYHGCVFNLADVWSCKTSRKKPRSQTGMWMN